MSSAENAELFLSIEGAPGETCLLVDNGVVLGSCLETFGESQMGHRRVSAFAIVGIVTTAASTKSEIFVFDILVSLFNG